MAVGDEPRHIPYGEGADLVRQLLHSSPSAMAVFQRDAVIRYVNPKLEELFGWTREELVGQPYVVLLAERMREEAAGQLGAYLELPEPQALAGDPYYPAQRKDGTEFPIKYTVAPIPAPDGLWVVVTLEDVSDLQAATDTNENLARAYRTLARMNEVVARAGDRQQLFDETCRVAYEEGLFVGAWVGWADGGWLRPIAVAGKLDHLVDTFHIPLDVGDGRVRGPSATAYLEDRPVYMRDFDADRSTEPWHLVGAEMGLAALVALPLRAAGRVVGILTLYAHRAGVFDEMVPELFERLAENVSVALDGFERQQELVAVAAQRRHLLSRLVTAEERERRRIAGEVHDESVQALAALDLRLGLLQRRARDSAPDLAPALDQLSDLLRGATTSLRDLMFNLDTPEVGASLRENLESAAEHVFVDGGLTWQVEADDVELGEIQLGQALRVTKEALINVRKHARASTVRITARARDAGVLVEIADDGVGLGDAAAQLGHRGLVTMRERADVSGGWLRTDGGPGEGTRVTFWLPLDGQLG